MSISEKLFSRRSASWAPGSISPVIKISIPERSARITKLRLFSREPSPLIDSKVSSTLLGHPGDLRRNYRALESESG